MGLARYGLSCGLPSLTKYLSMMRCATPGNRKMLQRAAHVTTFVARLQPTGENHIHRRPGHHPELTGPGHRIGQFPTGYAGTHPA
jgi:hypothetical protein